MDAHYTWARIGKHDATEALDLDWYLQRQDKPHILDIMGAPIQDPDEFKGYMEQWIKEGTTLCISGELKRYNEGNPASNYRNKDSSLNDNVIDNYVHMFEHHQEVTRGKPIIVNTIPRSWRKYSWLIQEDGNIIREDQEFRRAIDDPGGETQHDIEDTDLKMFLDYHGIYPKQLIKIRESCKGAKYHTYLIDMISFLYQMKMGHVVFSLDYRKVISGRIGLAPGGEKRILSFEDTKDSTGYVFFSPKKESVDQIYREFELAISLEENEVKANIRKHLLDHRIDRWTDFDANDTDDAFTILMMIHAFKGLVMSDDGGGDSFPYSDISMTSEEGIILDSLEKIMEPWFSQLA
jgi:hypothetical protein